MNYDYFKAFMSQYRRFVGCGYSYIYFCMFKVNIMEYYKAET